MKRKSQLIYRFSYQFYQYIIYILYTLFKYLLSFITKSTRTKNLNIPTCYPQQYYVEGGRKSRRQWQHNHEPTTTQRENFSNSEVKWLFFHSKIYTSRYCHCQTVWMEYLNANFGGDYFSISSHTFLLVYCIYCCYWSCWDNLPPIH